MKITRNGSDYELTREELREAYYAYELIIDIERAREDIPQSDIYDALPEEYKTEFCKTVAEGARHYFDTFGCKWSIAVDTAFEENEHMLAHMYAKALLCEKEPFSSMSEQDAEQAYGEIGEGLSYLMIYELAPITDALEGALADWREVYDETIALKKN